MRRISAENPTPLEKFVYVQSLGYEAYDGSLRGTRATIWSAAGNSADQASLLIALLRSSGVPARYRHGTLSVTDAQTVIGSMFPTPNAIRGHVPDDAATSDPLNDPDLLATVQDHWWVEAYLPGSGWTDLDPSFPVATIGASFATPVGDGTDQIAELPDAVRHKINLSLEVEQYSAFPVSGSNLSTLTPMAVSIPSVETSGEPISLGFIVDTETPGGFVFGNIHQIYEWHRE